MKSLRIENQSTTEISLFYLHFVLPGWRIAITFEMIVKISASQNWNMFYFRDK